MLERTFFQDILNTAGALRGLSDILQDATPEEIERYKIRAHLPRVAEQLVDELEAQRMLLRAENETLSAVPVEIDPWLLLRDVVDNYRLHSAAADREIALQLPDVCPSMMTDKTLLSRVLGNMIKNALEACAKGEKVTAGCRVSGDRIEFAVHNPGTIPRETELQIFQRSFSTKGIGRGIGTYSMKLLSERYLRGRVRFTTSEAEGTSFFASFPLEWREPSSE